MCRNIKIFDLFELQNQNYLIQIISQKLINTLKITVLIMQFKIKFILKKFFFFFFFFQEQELSDDYE